MEINSLALINQHYKELIKNCIDAYDSDSNDAPLRTAATLRNLYDFSIKLSTSARQKITYTFNAGSPLEILASCWISSNYDIALKNLSHAMTRSHRFCENPSTQAPYKHSLKNIIAWMYFTQIRMKPNDTIEIEFKQKMVNQEHPLSLFLWGALKNDYLGENSWRETCLMADIPDACCKVAQHTSSNEYKKNLYDRASSYGSFEGSFHSTLLDPENMNSESLDKKLCLMERQGNWLATDYLVKKQQNHLVTNIEKTNFLNRASYLVHLKIQEFLPGLKQLMEDPDFSSPAFEVFKKAALLNKKSLKEFVDTCLNFKSQIKSASPLSIKEEAACTVLQYASKAKADENIINEYVFLLKRIFIAISEEDLSAIDTAQSNIESDLLRKAHYLSLYCYALFYYRHKELIQKESDTKSWKENCTLRFFWSFKSNQKIHSFILPIIDQLGTMPLFFNHCLSSCKVDVQFAGSLSHSALIIAQDPKTKIDETINWRAISIQSWAHAICLKASGISFFNQCPEALKNEVLEEIEAIASTHKNGSYYYKLGKIYSQQSHALLYSDDKIAFNKCIENSHRHYESALLHNIKEKDKKKHYELSQNIVHFIFNAKESPTTQKNIINSLEQKAITDANAACVLVRIFSSLDDTSSIGYENTDNVTDKAAQWINHLVSLGNNKSSETDEKSLASALDELFSFMYAHESIKLKTIASQCFLSSFALSESYPKTYGITQNLNLIKSACEEAIKSFNNSNVTEEIKLQEYSMTWEILSKKSLAAIQSLDDNNNTNNEKIRLMKLYNSIDEAIAQAYANKIESTLNVSYCNLIPPRILETVMNKLEVRSNLNGNLCSIFGDHYKMIWDACQQSDSKKIQTFRALTVDTYANAIRILPKRDFIKKIFVINNDQSEKYKALLNDIIKKLEDIAITDTRAQAGLLHIYSQFNKNPNKETQWLNSIHQLALQNDPWAINTLSDFK